MTTLQLLHATEEMEAVRRDFHRFWDTHLVPSLEGMSTAAGHRITPREAGMVYHAAWIAFVEGSGIRRGLDSSKS